MMMSRSFIKNSIESIEWSYNDYSYTISDALFSDGTISRWKAENTPD